jgi:YVTN family beta-propeller protein
MDRASTRGRRIIRAVIAGVVALGALPAVAPGQGRETVYVVNVASDDMSVIDPSAAAVVATIPSAISRTASPSRRMGGRSMSRTCRTTRSR